MTDDDVAEDSFVNSLPPILTSRQWVAKEPDDVTFSATDAGGGPS